jgi:hypothetical protein
MVTLHFVHISPQPIQSNNDIYNRFHLLWLFHKYLDYYRMIYDNYPSFLVKTFLMMYNVVQC